MKSYAVDAGRLTPTDLMDLCWPDRYFRLVHYESDTGWALWQCQLFDGHLEVRLPPEPGLPPVDTTRAWEDLLGDLTSAVLVAHVRCGRPDVPIYSWYAPFPRRST